MTLDYRFPHTPEHRAVRVLAELQSEQSIDWMLAVVKLLAGVPLTLAPAWLVATYSYMVKLKHPEAISISFWWLALITVPLMLWLERRERQDFIWEATQEPFWMIVLDVLLIGPRMLWSLYDLLHRPPPDEEAVALAAVLVVELLDHDRTVEIRELLTDDRSAPELRRALRHLENRRWIVIARCRSRIWLATSVRSQFGGMK